jgi:anhydro-N-acetylmuramic acid kinase
MTYKVIGLMSGSSLDGLDLAYVQLTEKDGSWTFRLIAADCIPYPQDWIAALKDAPSLPITKFIPLHTAYGKLLGMAISMFIKRHSLQDKVDFVSSHGHTVFHAPQEQATYQIGEGAAIAAACHLPVITDLRAMDVAHGGQGAPIVPIGDQLLFPEYDYWLNLGGIANITIKAGQSFKAFDICPCNQVLNSLAAREGLEYDKDGLLAAGGTLKWDVLDALNAQDYFSLSAPKSLSNEAAMQLGRPVLSRPSTASTPDLLHTYVNHIAQQINNVINPEAGKTKLLATGGGALNTHLINELSFMLNAKGVELVVPPINVVQYKEAIVMALIGALRWRKEVNVLHSVTGARKDTIGGAIWWNG